MSSRRDFLRALASSAVAFGPAWAAAGAAAPAPRRILYISGRLSSPRAAVLERTVARLGPSGFNVVILAFLYARWRGGRLELTYNGVPFARLQARLAPYLRRLRTGFPVRKRLLLSLGGWGNAGSFAAIRAAGVERFLRQLDAEAVGPLGLEGLDLDLEPGTVAENTAAGWRAVHEEFGGTLVAITNGYRARHPSHSVTHAPIASVAAGLYARDGSLKAAPGGLFAACRRAGGGNNISWLNVQFYEAGDPASPKAPAIWGQAAKAESIAEFYKSEILLPLIAARGENGLAHPAQALAPGFEPRYRLTGAGPSAAAPRVPLVLARHGAPTPCRGCASLLTGAGPGARQDRAFCGATLRAIVDETAAWGAPAGAFLWEYGQIAGEIQAWGRTLGLE